MSRILFLSQWLPYPTDNGSKVRIYNLLRSLSQRHEVTLLSFTDCPLTNSNHPELESFCQNVQVVPWQPFDRQSKRARLGFFSLTPRSFVATYSPQMAGLIQRTLAARQYDLVIASQTTMASYVRSLRGVPALFEEAELGVFYDEFIHASSTWRRLRYAPTWAKHRRYLSLLLRQFRACTVVSEHERTLLKNHIATERPVLVIPNFVHLTQYEMPRGLARPNTLIFTGSFRYFANHDAMVWFLNEVYPQIRSQVPDAQLIITGDHADLPLPAAEGVTLKGNVENIRPLVSTASVSLAPLRFGGGTRLKIVEAMALQTPVVATSKGAEGLDVHDGEHLLIADSAQDFALQVIRLLKDSALRQQLAENAFQLVRAKYDSAVVLPHFLDLVENVIRN